MINKAPHSKSQYLPRHLMWLSLLAISNTLLAQPAAPTNFCISVNNAGFIELTWTPSVSPDPFLNYQIFRDTGVGFQNVATIGPPTASLWVDFTASPNQQNTYFIQSIVNSVTSAPTPSMSNIALNLSAAQLSIPQLTWNSPFSGPLPAGEIRIYRSVDSNPYDFYATLPITRVSYNDTLFGLCTDTLIAYKVSYAAVGCEQFSQIRENEFRDNLAPTQPVIETVTVDDNNNITTYWYPVNVPDLNFYRIQSINIFTQQFINIGTVPTTAPTEFIFTSASTTNSTTIGVIAFDQCGNEASFGTAVTSIFVEGFHTECSLEVLLSWTAYDGWAEGVTNYGIYSTVDGGTPVLIDEVGFQSLFYMAEVEPNKDYCFWIEARSNGIQRPARSNRYCVETTYPQIVAFNYLHRVTTIDDNTISVQLLQDLDADGTIYELYRAKGSGSFLKIATLPKTNVDIQEYIDTEVDPSGILYKYKWHAFDGCNTFISESNVSTNIALLIVADNRELTNYLSWNEYTGWEGSVIAYDIYRKTVTDADFVLLTSVLPNQLLYDDNVEAFSTTGGDFCYMVRAREGQNSFGMPATSESNKTCVSQEPLIWIPNTIVINGQPENRIFKPVASFIDFDTYQMEIYNKWGEKLFSSSDIENGWDGHYMGNPVREDYYQYIIVFRDGGGKSYIERDVVYVLRN